MNKESILARTFFALQLLAAVVTVLFFVCNFPIVGHDSYFHLTNLDQYITLRAEHVTFPHWTPNNFRGLGSSNLYFYPPMVSMLGAMLHLLGGTVEQALNRVALLSTLLSLITCLWYLRFLGFSLVALLPASLLYAIGPYAFFDAVIRSDFSEYLAFAWVPLVFIGIEWSLRTQKLRSRQGLMAAMTSAVGLALLTLTSIPMLLVVLICIAVLTLNRVGVRNIRGFLPFGVGALVSVILTSFYTFPIFYFRKDAQLGHLAEVAGSAPFAQNPFSQLFSGHEGSGSLLTLWYLVFCLFLCWSWFQKWRDTRSRDDLGWILIIVVVLVAHVPFIAAPLARLLPLFGLIHFPSRFFLIVCLASSVWFAEALARTRVAILYQGASAIVVLLLAATIVARVPYGSRYQLEHESGWSVSEYAPEQAPHDPDALGRLANRHWHDSELASIDPIASQDSLVTVGRGGNYSEFLIHLTVATSVQFHRFYWPQWRLAKDDGNIIPLSADSNGILHASLPSGRYGLRLQMEPSNSERWGEQLSLFGGAGLALLWIAMMIFYRTPHSNQSGSVRAS
jgi:hypothetical protein